VLALTYHLIICGTVKEYRRKQGILEYNRFRLPEFSVGVTLMCVCVYYCIVSPQNDVKKVKISMLQVVEAHKVARG
jgi:hypothetical protein